MLGPFSLSRDDFGDGLDSLLSVKLQLSDALIGTTHIE
jgi:hypothetical protein